MVDLKPLKKQSAYGVSRLQGCPCSNMTEMRLKTLIERHIHYTDSAIGKDCGTLGYRIGEFVKVMPQDYRRALLRNAELTVPPRGAKPMGKPTGFLELDRADRAYRPSTNALATTRNSLSRCPKRSSGPGLRAAWIAVFRSATTAARSITRSPIGMIWSMMAMAEGTAEPALHQQLSQSSQDASARHRARNPASEHQ